MRSIDNELVALGHFVTENRKEIKLHKYFRKKKRCKNIQFSICENIKL